MNEAATNAGVNGGARASEGEVARLRDQVARLTAERDALAVEARRVGNGWSAISEELKACKRRLDHAEGDKLIAGARARELEEKLGATVRAQQELRRQLLYRVLRRAGLLRGLADAPKGPDTGGTR